LASGLAQAPIARAVTAQAAAKAGAAPPSPASAATRPTSSPPTSSSPAATPPVDTAQLRRIACRALVDNNDPAEAVRYRAFFQQQCKGYRPPRAWMPPVQAARVAPAKPRAARAADRVRRDVAAEASQPPAQVVPSDGGPSFDCRQAVARAEQLVCADALLSLLDRELAQAVSDAERRVPDPTALRRDQDDWRARVRDACQTLSCLERVYTQRTAGLRAIGGFAEVK
jgi:hypothetical protein